MEVVVALPLDRDAVVSRHLAAGAWGLKGKLANSARIGSLNIPLPGGNGVPTIYLDFHADLNSVIRAFKSKID